MFLLYLITHCCHPFPYNNHFCYPALLPYLYYTLSSSPTFIKPYLPPPPPLSIKSLVLLLPSSLLIFSITLSPLISLLWNELILSFSSFILLYVSFLIVVPFISVSLFPSSLLLLNLPYSYSVVAFSFNQSLSPSVLFHFLYSVFMPLTFIQSSSTSSPSSSSSLF